MEARRTFALVGGLAGVLWMAVVQAPASADAPSTQAGVQIGQGACRIATLTEQYAVANQKAADASAKLADLESQMADTQQRLGTTRTLLHSEALKAYMDAGTDTNAPGLGVPISTFAVRAQYLHMATGSVADTLDTLRLGRSRLQTLEFSARQTRETAQQALQQVSDSRQSALSQAGRVQAMLDQVQAPMAQLVAEKMAACVPGAGASAPQGLPTNGGLVSVVQRTVSAPAGGVSGDVWARLRQCESGGNYATNTGNGFYGAYQFTQSTWTGLGYPGRPDLAPPAMQDEAAQKLQARSGWGQWPACSAALGLR
jgi:hypothetical protein